MQQIATHITNDLQHATLKVLQYYSLFKYPVNAIEIHGSCSQKCSLDEVALILATMKNEGSIYSYNSYYSIHINVQEEVTEREKANELAIEKEKLAKKAGRLIYKFPFVKFVGISGSLSKGCATAHSDFDFFIITEQNRLWISRTLLHLFKKFTFLVGRQHRFCMNYFIDTDAMTIADKNIFTAVELSSLLPLHGSEAYNGLMEANKWVPNILPNGYVRFKKYCAITNDISLLKKITEAIFNKLLPNKLNEWLMQFTDKRWRKKWAKKDYPMNDYELAFRTTIHISKNHPANYQQKVLARLQQTGFDK